MHVRGKIPNGWSEKCFKDIAMIDKESLKETTLNDYKFSYISLSDVNKGSISNQLSEYIFSDAPSRARRVVRQYDVLMSTVRPNLQAFCRIQDDVKDIVASTGFAVITPKVKTDSEYIYQYLYSLEVARQVYALVVGSNYPAINSSDVRKLKVLFPNEPVERIKISQILSTWDKAIEKLEALIAAKQKRKKALMQQLLAGKKRFAGFDESWMEISMGDIFKRVTRKNTEENTNVVTISAQKGLIKQGEFFNKSIASEVLDNYFLLKSGEFAYNKSYSNGYPMGAVKRLNNYDKAVVTTLYICFAIKDKNISSSNFFEQYFEAGRLVHGLMKVANEGGRAHGLLNVTPKDFFGLKLFIPKLPEQQKIASVLSFSDTEIQIHQNQLSALKQQKKGLMQQLLTGKKRVNLEEAA